MTTTTGEKISAALKGKPKSPEHRANMRKPKSEEHKAKIAASLKGRSPSPESIAKCIETYRLKALEKETTNGNPRRTTDADDLLHIHARPDKQPRNKPRPKKSDPNIKCILSMFHRLCNQPGLK